MYPKNWPRCIVCDDYALDGHITCGRAECNESRRRAERAHVNARLNMISAKDAQKTEDEK